MSLIGLIVSGLFACGSADVDGSPTADATESEQMTEKGVTQQPVAFQPTSDSQGTTGQQVSVSSLSTGRSRSTSTTAGKAATTGGSTARTTGTTTTTTAATGATAAVGSAVTAPSNSSANTISATNWVDTIVGDMTLFHDGPVAVLSRLAGWGSGASKPEATPRPAGWQYAIPWTHIAADTSHSNGNGYPWRVPGPYSGNQAPNTRVQQSDIQMWWLLSNGQWVLGSRNDQPEPVMFPLSWTEGKEVRASDVWRDERSNGGGASLRSLGREAYSAHIWHAWAAPHVIPANAVGAVSVFFARLILDNPAGNDDRHLARLLAAGAGDWYKDSATLSSTKTQGQNVLYMGFSRFKYVTKNWQMFAWTSLSEAQIRSNPPPIVGLSR